MVLILSTSLAIGVVSFGIVYPLKCCTAKYGEDGQDRDDMAQMTSRSVSSQQILNYRMFSKQQGYVIYDNNITL